MTEAPSSPPSETSNAQALFASKRYFELKTLLEENESFAFSPEGIELRAQLAARRESPLVDALRAFVLQRDENPAHASTHAAHAIRLLADAGATESAKRLWQRAQDTLGRQDALDLVHAQMASGITKGRNRAAWEIQKLLSDGVAEKTLTQLKRESQTQPVSDRTWVWQLLADLYRDQRDYSAAAESFASAIDDAPDAYEADALRLAAAYCLWSAGHVEPALQTLRDVRERTRKPQGLSQYVHSEASRMLQHFDQQPDATAEGPQWQYLTPQTTHRICREGPGRGILRMVERFLGIPAAEIPQAMPTMAHLRFHLKEHGASAIRLELSPEVIRQALAAGAAVVVEEERSSNTGFLWVDGFDPRSDLMLLYDPERAGPFLRPFDDQRARSALHALGGLIITGLNDNGQKRLASLEAGGVKHDPRFDAVDHCDVDQYGKVPPGARVAILAEAATEVAPDFPMAHKRLGESLLDAVRAGRHRVGRFERWYAEARARFPNAEWAMQTYAHWLGIQRRVQEEGIAWHGAYQRDPWDERNTFGMARVDLLLHRPEQARLNLRRTLTSKPAHAEAMARLSELCLAEAEDEIAEVLSEAAYELAPQDIAVLSIRASVQEQQGQFDNAIASLDEILTIRETDAVSRARRLRRLSHMGDWPAARAEADILLRLGPEDVYNWMDAAWTAWCAADRDQAFEYVMHGLQRCSPHRVLIDEAARVIAMLFAPEMWPEVTDVLYAALRAQPTQVMDAAAALGRFRLYDHALTLATHAHPLMPGNANGPWRLVQTMLRHESVRDLHQEDIPVLLNETIELAGTYAHPRVVLGFLELSRDPEKAIHLAEHADLSTAPTLPWLLMAHAYQALGKGAEAAEMFERLQNLQPSHIVGPANFLANVSLSEVAIDLLKRVNETSPQNVSIVLELSRTLGKVGRYREGFDALSVLPEAMQSPSLFADLAEHCDEYDRLIEVGVREIDRAMRESGPKAYDTWKLRAQIAGARLALGDEQAREDYLASAGHHPRGRMTLLRIATKIKHPMASTDHADLKSLAPGAIEIMNRGGEEW